MSEVIVFLAVLAIVALAVVLIAATGVIALLVVLLRPFLARFRPAAAGPALQPEPEWEFARV